MIGVGERIKCRLCKEYAMHKGVEQSSSKETKSKKPETPDMLKGQSVRFAEGTNPSKDVISKSVQKLNTSESILSHLQRKDAITSAVQDMSKNSGLRGDERRDMSKRDFKEHQTRVADQANLNKLYNETTRKDVLRKDEA
jgi:hypothetical protein